MRTPAFLKMTAAPVCGNLSRCPQEWPASPDCCLLVSTQLSNRRNPSFRLAVEARTEGEVWPSSVCLRADSPPHTCFQKMVRRLARDFLTDEGDRRFYADRYTCCPPPIFVPIITLLEVRSERNMTLKCQCVDDLCVRGLYGVRVNVWLDVILLQV